MLVTAAVVVGWLGSAEQEGRLVDSRTVVASVTRAVPAWLGLPLAYGFGRTVAFALSVCSIHLRERACERGAGVISKCP